MEWITGFIVGITAIISAVGTLIVTTYKTKKQLEETIPKKLKKQCAIDMEIVSKMEQVKELLGADRVQIYDFHNGGHYANGRSALKTTCTYEVVRVGVRPFQMELQAVPLSCIPRFTKMLLDKEEIKVTNLEDIKTSMPSTYDLKHYQGITSFYDIILKNKEGEPIGFLAIQYTKSPYQITKTVDMQEVLRLKFFIEENLEKMIKNK